MPNETSEVTYTIGTQDDGKFIIPKKVWAELGIPDGEYPPLYLEIKDAETGDLLLEKAHHNMNMSPEILNASARAVIESHQQIRITVSRVD